MKYGSKQHPGFGLFAEPKMRLGLKEQRSGRLPELKVIVEKEHRWERGREIINFRRLLLEFPSVSKQVMEKLSGLRWLAEFFERRSRIIGHLAECADAHLLKIALEVRRGGPVMPRRFSVAGRSAGAAEPIMDMALVGEEVFGFTQIVRRCERVFKARTSS